MSITQELTKQITGAGCNIFGFADLRSLPKDMRQYFDYGIIVALPYSKDALEENINGSPQRYYDERVESDKRLRGLSTMLVNYLLTKSYKAFAAVASATALDDDLRSLLPIKTIATLAGMGWAGKCSLLVTKEAGTALNMVHILTDAPLECGMPVTESSCPSDCTVCKDICPGGAILGNTWKAGVDRDTLVNAHTCKAAGSARGKEKVFVESQWGCGLCMASCPVTRRVIGY